MNYSETSLVHGFNYAKQFKWNGKRLMLFMNGDGSFEIIDKNTNKKWKWEKLEDFQVKSVIEKKNGFSLQISQGNNSFIADLVLNPNENKIKISLKGNSEYKVHPLKFPGRFVSSGDNLILPLNEGLIIPPGDSTTQKPFQIEKLFGKFNISGHVSGVSLPWIGLTDFKSGLMMLVEETSDVQFDVNKISDGFSSGIIWLPQMGKFGYERSLLLIFPDKGGYVPMAKIYREYLKEKGEWVSLEQKKVKNEKVGRLVGALDVWLTQSKTKDDRSYNKKLGDKLRTTYKYLNEKVAPSGCLVSFGFHAGSLNKYKKKKELIEDINKTGCLTSRYINHFEVFPKENIRFLNNGLPVDYYREGYPEEVCKLVDGSLKKGFLAATKRNNDGTVNLEEGTIQGYQRNTRFIWDWLKKDVSRLKNEADYDAIFYDVAGASAPIECYNPEYLLTRREDMEYRKSYFKFLMDNGYVIGTENGADWLIPVVHYIEGIGTIQKASIKGVRVGVTPFETTPYYEGINLSEYYRIPLFQLVFHDAVFSSFRWNYTPDRYRNRALWKKHDLFVLLYGYMPIFVENYETLLERSKLLKDSITPILDWHAKIGMAELVDHRYLTLDRKIQESRFSSGWAIVVNFSDNEYKIDSQKKIAPMSYITYKWESKFHLQQ